MDSGRGGGISKDGLRVGCGCAKDVEGMGGVEWDVVGCYVWNEKMEMFSIFPKIGFPRFGCWRQKY